MMDLIFRIREIFVHNHVFMFFVIDVLIFILVLLLFIKIILLNKKIKKLTKKETSEKYVANIVDESKDKLELDEEKIEEAKIEFNDEKIEEDEISFLVSQLSNDKSPKCDTSEVDTVATVDIHVDDILEQIDEKRSHTHDEKDDNIEKTLDNLVYIKKCLVEKIKNYNEEIISLEHIEDQQLKKDKKNEILKKLKIVKIELEEYRTLEQQVFKMIKNKNTHK